MTAQIKPRTTTSSDTSTDALARQAVLDLYKMVEFLQRNNNYRLEHAFDLEQFKSSALAKLLGK